MSRKTTDFREEVHKLHEYFSRSSIGEADWDSALRIALSGSQPLFFRGTAPSEIQVAAFSGGLKEIASYSAVFAALAEEAERLKTPRRYQFIPEEVYRELIGTYFPAALKRVKANILALAGQEAEHLPLPLTREELRTAAEPIFAFLNRETPQVKNEYVSWRLSPGINSGY
ncbi:MAG: hypothetical protein V1820_01090 [archaeon]